MSYTSEDIQYAGSDTRPPMLGRTDYESWQQRGVEGALQLGPEQDRVFSDLTQEENDRMFVVDTLRIIKEDNFKGTIQEDLLELGMQEPKRPQDSDYFKDKMLLMQAQENGAVFDEQQLLFLAEEQVTNFDDDVDDPPEQDLALNVDHVFEADQCDAFDSDVDEAPTTQTMFMVNLSFEDPIYNEAGPSYDMDIPYEVQDHDNCSDGVYEHYDEHEMQNNVQQDYITDSDADYTSNSNIILYDQYVEDNGEQDVEKLKAKGDIEVFVGYSKESAAFRIYNKQTQKSSNRSVSKVDEASKNDLEDLIQDFYDEYFDSLKIMKSSTTNVETLIIEEVFHEVSDHFKENLLHLL
nr:hypothetical protein [Tanacetum cinerariifolium]